MIPLLAPKALIDFAPQEFHEYVKSLYIEPPKAVPPAEYSVTLNAKGNPVIRIRREPKWLTSAEVSLIANDIGWDYQRLWMHIRGKKIDIKLPEVRK